MGRVGEDVEQLAVAPRPTTVLGWAGAPTVDARRDGSGGIRRQHLLDDDRLQRGAPSHAPRWSPDRPTLGGGSGPSFATHRDYLAAGHPLRRAWGSLIGPLVTRLFLPPLSPDAVTGLGSGSDVEPMALHARTGGNPFFVIEVLAEETAGLPPTVRDTVLATNLHREARDCLDAAAVSGRHATAELVARAGDCDATAIDECVAAGLVVTDGDQVQFRHDLTR